MRFPTIAFILVLGAATAASGQLPPADECASGTATFRIRPGGELYVGWTGLAYDLPLPRGGELHADLTCPANGNSCTVSGTQPADTLTGPPIPFTAAGLSMCVVTRLRAPISGTFNCEFGCNDVAVDLGTAVYLQQAAPPCPACLGDPTPRDGVKGGTCNGGTSAGSPCDLEGAPTLGSTSRDCLPSGSSVGEPDVQLALTTATATLAGSFDCLAAGYPAGACHCPNQQRPNACLDGVCPTSGVCESGPLAETCSGKPERACSFGSGTAECEDVEPGAGFCTVEPRQCRPNPTISLGSCLPESSGWTAGFCVPPTRSAAINSTVGLPGPATLFLPYEIERTAVPTCAARPRTGCRRIAPGHRTTLSLRNHLRGDGDELAWRWLGGEATALEDLGDPRTTDDYALCTYIGSEMPALIASTQIERGDRWRARAGGGFVHRNPAGAPDGITRVELVPGATGAARIVVHGRGPRLPLPLLPMPPAPVTVQLTTDGGACWEATYEPEHFGRNDRERFRAVLRAR
jgi:hypothetical protein